MCKKTCSSSNGESRLSCVISTSAGPFVRKAAARSSQLAQRYPKTLFSLMIVQLLASMFLCFKGLQARPAELHVPVHEHRPIVFEKPGPGELSAALAGMLAIRSSLDSLSRLHTLTSSDSARLRSDAAFLQSLSGLMVRPESKPVQH